MNASRAGLLQSRQRPLSRRAFLALAGGVPAGFAWLAGARAAVSVPAGPPQQSPAERARILDLIEAHRPSRLSRLPPGFCDQVGAAHVGGKYHLTTHPFLLEGGRKLIELGSRLGKFWFMPDNPAQSYPYQSTWGKYASFVELARSDYFERLFHLPFTTILLEAHAPLEARWRNPGLKQEFYDAITKAFYELTAHLYRAFHDRAVTFVLQHWEGDWLLRGSGQKWDPPPEDWRARCDRMARWLAARQAGVSRARREFGVKARCKVAHAAEVNRVADAWKNIPTMTRHVLPRVELDLVSYSAYDAQEGGPLHFWNCIEEIRRHARTGPLFGAEAVYVGEFGIPENDQPRQITERLDEWMGVMLAARVHFMAYWQLYCNEFAGKPQTPPRTPVTDPRLVRGFWLVKPDGSLSESGRYFSGLWRRAG